MARADRRDCPRFRGTTYGRTAFASLSVMKIGQSPRITGVGVPLCARSGHSDCFMPPSPRCCAPLTALNNSMLSARCPGVHTEWACFGFADVIVRRAIHLFTRHDAPHLGQTLVLNAVSNLLGLGGVADTLN